MNRLLIAGTVVLAGMIPVGTKAQSNTLNGTVAAYLNNGAQLCLSGAFSNPFSLILEQNQARFKASNGQLQVGSTTRDGGVVTFKYMRENKNADTVNGEGDSQETITITVDLTNIPPLVTWAREKPQGRSEKVNSRSYAKYLPKKSEGRICTNAERTQLVP